MSHGHQESVLKPSRSLKRREARCRCDFAQAISTAGSTAVLRDKYDVAALVKRISEMFSDSAVANELYAAADKVRQQQPRVGRPSKQAKEGAGKDRAL